MICKSCGGEFNEEYFAVCPYCLEPFTEKKSTCAMESVIPEIKDASIEEPELPDETGGDVYISSNVDVKDNISVSEINIAEENDSLFVDENIGMEREVASTSEKKDYLSFDDIEGLSVRALNAMHRAGLFTINELIDFLSEHTLSEIRNVGAKTISELEDLVEQYNGGDIEFKKISIDDSKMAESNACPFSNISPDLDGMSTLTLSEFGFTKQQARRMAESGYVSLGALREVSLGQLLSVLGKKGKDVIISAGEYLENDIITIFEKFLETTINDRNGYVFLQRAKGKTLQEIADNSVDIFGQSITRERVRQIEAKFMTRIVPFVSTIMMILKGENHYVMAQDILDIYDNDDYDLIFIHACKALNEFEYWDFADIFIECIPDSPSAVNRLLTTLDDYIGDELDLEESREEIESLLEENGFDYLEIGAVVGILEKNGYRRYGNYITKGSASYATLCRPLIRKYFPNGIKLSQNETEQTEDLIKLRKLVEEECGGYKLPDSDRTVSSALTRCGLILRDRGKYVLRDLIQVDYGTIKSIKAKIDENVNDKLFYSEIYAENEGMLNITCGIDNYNYLHGVLQAYFPTDFEYHKDYLIKNGAKIDDVQGLEDRICNYILEMGRPVSKKELWGKFNGFSDIMLIMSFVNDDRLLQWDYNYFACTGILQISQDEVEGIDSIISELLARYHGYASDKMILKRLKQEMPYFVESNHITVSLNAFYVCSKLFGEKYDFKRPHVCTKGKFEKISTKDIVIELMGDPKELSYKRYKEVTDELMWPVVTVGSVFSDIETDYVRLSEDLYLKKTDFNISADIVDYVEKDIRTNLVDGIVSLMNYDFDDYPEFEYEWNEFLLQSIIDELLDDFIIVSPALLDRRYQKSFAVLKDTGMVSYPQIVACRMKNLGKEEMSEAEFLSFLVLNRLTRKVIPNELLDSEYLRKEGDRFVLVEK